MLVYQRVTNSRTHDAFAFADSFPQKMLLLKDVEHSHPWPGQVGTPKVETESSPGER